MFNNSLREEVGKVKRIYTIDDSKEESKLDIKLSQEAKENYTGWLNDPVTKIVLSSLEEIVTQNNIKLLNHCLGTGLDRSVDERRVLYFSLKNKVIEELLRVLRR